MEDKDKPVENPLPGATIKPGQGPPPGAQVTPTVTPQQPQQQQAEQQDNTPKLTPVMPKTSANFDLPPLTQNQAASSSPPTVSQGAPIVPGGPTQPMSASQMGLTQPKSKFLEINIKNALIWGAILLVVGLIAASVLYYFGFISLTEFRKIYYDNGKGNSYNLQFYGRHSKGKTKSGTTQLVSKVTKEGKFPILFSISNDATQGGIDKLKDCIGITSKSGTAFEVDMPAAEGKVKVCDFSTGTYRGLSDRDLVYVGGFKKDDTVHTFVISQDIGGRDLSSSPEAAQEFLSNLGMQPYKEDIKKILGSLEVVR